MPEIEFGNSTGGEEGNNGFRKLILPKAEKKIAEIFQQLNIECVDEPIEGDNLEDLNFVRDMLHDMRMEYRSTDGNDPDRKAELKRILEKFSQEVG